MTAGNEDISKTTTRSLANTRGFNWWKIRIFNIQPRQENPWKMGRNVDQ